MNNTMKNLKDEIEGIKKEFEERFWSRLTNNGDSPSGCEEIWDFVEEKLTQSTTSLIEQEKEKSEQIGFNKAWAVVKALMSYKTPEEALQYLAERKDEK